MAVKPRQLTYQEAKEFYDLTHEDITATRLKNWFAVKGGQTEAKYQTNDRIVLPKMHPHCFNQEEIITTLGRFLFNFFALPDEYLKKHGYVNEPFDCDMISGIEKKMGAMLMVDEITVKEYGKYFDRAEWMLMGMAYYLAPTLNYDLNIAPKEIIEYRNELFDKHKDALKKNDPVISQMIEKEVVAKTKEHVKTSDNEAFDLFRSGSFKIDNYKKASVMSGMLENPYSHKIEIMKSNYTEGVSKDEFSKFPMIALVGGYSRGVETATGGYQTKRIQAATQNIILGEPDSDCGTTNFLDVEILPSLKNMYSYRYILGDDGKLLEITPDNISQYFGKRVKMRSPMFCTSEHVCNKCAGNLFRRMGIKNAGLFTGTFSGVLMNLFMKKFHESSVKFKKLDITGSIKKL